MKTTDSANIMISISGVEPPDWDRLVRDAHSVNPGCTSKSLSQARDEAGRSSYEILADVIVSAIPTVACVLDLACGDGELIDELNRQSSSRLRTIGIDRSQHEVSLACERTRTTVIAADATRLPLQADAFDAVACHMALMLFADLPAVLRGLARALKSDGLLAAVVPISSQLRGNTLRKPSEVCRAAVLQWWEAEFGSRPPVPNTGAELEDDEQITSIFAEAGFTAPRRRIVRVTLHAMPKDIWDNHLANLYLIWALDANRTARLREVVLTALGRHADSDDRVRFDIPLAFITAIKARRSGK